MLLLAALKDKVVYLNLKPLTRLKTNPLLLSIL